MPACPSAGAGGLGLYPAVWRHGVRRHQAGGLPQPPDVHREAGDHGGGAGAAAAPRQGQHLLSMPLGKACCWRACRSSSPPSASTAPSRASCSASGTTPGSCAESSCGGSALPLVLYVLWQIAILGLLGQQSLIQTGGALDSLLANVGGLVSWPPSTRRCICSRISRSPPPSSG